jgi:hypothetical protein
MLLCAEDVADNPVAPGVTAPFVAVSMFEVGMDCPGAKVLSKWEEDTEDSSADSGFVGCLRASRAAPSVLVRLTQTTVE